MRCEYCGTLTGVHGFSFDDQNKKNGLDTWEWEAQRVEVGNDEDDSQGVLFEVW